MKEERKAHLRQQAKARQEVLIKRIRQILNEPDWNYIICSGPVSR